MFRPRYLFLFVFLALATILPHGIAKADQPFQRFLPLLVDLSGWQGGKADGMSMQMSDTSMTTATRDYERSGAKIHAIIMVGQSAEGALAPLQSGMNLQTPEGHMVTTTVRGVPVLKAFNTKDKSGNLMVALDKNAMFNFAYEGLAEEEALALADKFDWKALQAAAQKQ
ncbi:hypothetical protein JQ612_06075 [Bradyrhizobium manausense]|nr:hypothetical protein [Bradyrhizobium manausense]MBR0689205.1 hypothetical protein [Bradyrhizobium manausense]MBR0721660.1 hypothetical protein [Bradyrhizobium manausense]MBR0832757.1 hypothetical protein [Bradyrhizobium manausense]